MGRECLIQISRRPSAVEASHSKPIFNLMKVLQETSGDHQSHYDASCDLISWQLIQ